MRRVQQLRRSETPSRRSVTSPARLAVALQGPSARTYEPERIRHETLLPWWGCPAQRGPGYFGRGAGRGPDAHRSALACRPFGVLRGPAGAEGPAFANAGESGQLRGMCGDGRLARNANKALAVLWEKRSADVPEGSGDAKNYLEAQLRVIKITLSRVFS